MNGILGFQEMWPANSRLQSYRFLDERQHLFGPGSERLEAIPQWLQSTPNQGGSNLILLGQGNGPQFLSNKEGTDESR